MRLLDEFISGLSIHSDIYIHICIPPSSCQNFVFVAVVVAAAAVVVGDAAVFCEAAVVVAAAVVVVAAPIIVSAAAVVASAAVVAVFVGVVVAVVVFLFQSWTTSSGDVLYSLLLILLNFFTVALTSDEFSCNLLIFTFATDIQC